MSNFLIKDIRGPKDGKFQSAEGKKFLPFDEYLIAARKVIKSFAPQLNIPQYKVEQMLSGEDYCAEIAMHMMLADLSYDETKAKGKTPYSWRNYQGMRSLQDCLDIPHNKKNRQHQSLDGNIGDPDDNVSPLTFHADLIAEPYKIVGKAERRERVRKYVRFLLKNANLSPVQQRCIHLRFFGGPHGVGIENYKEIGETFDPPVSRQNVKQIINRALFKLKQVAKGSGQ